MGHWPGSGPGSFFVASPTPDWDRGLLGQWAGFLYTTSYIGVRNK